MKTTKLALSLILIIQSFIGFSQDYYLHCGSILDVQTGKEIKKATIIVKNNKISSISEGYITKGQEKDVEIDLKNKFILPIPSQVIIGNKAIIQNPGYW